MKKLISKQTNIAFLTCTDPVTIDKRASWGNNESNLQSAPNGGFLKLKDATTISHLVQGNADMTAPVGWIPTGTPGLFDKKPIWIDEQFVPANTPYKLKTLDGEMEYNLAEDAYICYNSKDDGEPDLADVWLQKESDVKKNYIF